MLKRRSITAQRVAAERRESSKGIPRTKVSK